MLKSIKKFSIFVITGINNTTILKLGLAKSFDMANKLQALSGGYMQHQAGSDKASIVLHGYNGRHL